MKDYSVTVEITFSVTAGSEEKAEERAQQVADAITVHKTATWLGDPEIGEPTVEEA